MLNFSYTSQIKSKLKPSRNLIDKIIRRTLQKKYSVVSLSIIIVDNQLSQEYNQQYRNKNSPTNVISLEFAESRDKFNLLTGELILAEDIIKQEAVEQNKPILNHYIHMLVHGILHLQGYDHIEDADAKIMEQLEIDILDSFAIANPYLLDNI